MSFKVVRRFLLIFILALACVSLCSCAFFDGIFGKKQTTGTTIPAPSNVAVDSDSCTITWEKVTGANQYGVYMNDRLIGTTHENSFVYTPISDDMRFYIKTIVIENEEYKYSENSEVAVVAYVDVPIISNVSQTITGASTVFNWETDGAVDEYRYFITCSATHETVSGTTRDSFLAFEYKEDGEYTFVVEGVFGNRTTKNAEFVYSYSKDAVTWIRQTSGTLDYDKDADIFVPIAWGNSSFVSIFFQDREYSDVTSNEYGVYIYSDMLEGLPLGTYTFVIKTTLNELQFELTIEDNRAPIALQNLLRYNDTEAQPFYVPVEAFGFEYSACNIDNSTSSVKGGSYDRQYSLVAIPAVELKGLSVGEHTVCITFDKQSVKKRVEVPFYYYPNTEPYVENTICYDKNSQKELALEIYNGGSLQLSRVSGNGITAADYYQNNKNIILSAQYLKRLESGSYQFLISLANSSRTCSIFFTLQIIHSQPQIYGLSLDMDNAFPRVRAAWQDDADTSELYTIFLDGKRVGSTREKSYVFDYFDRTRAHVISVKRGDFSCSYTYDQPTEDKSEYLINSFDFVGKRYDLVIGSDEELLIFFEYALNELVLQNHDSGATYLRQTVYIEDYDNTSLMSKLMTAQEAVSEIYSCHLEYDDSISGAEAVELTFNYVPTKAEYSSGYMSISQNVAINNAAIDLGENDRVLPIEKSSKPTRRVVTTQQLLSLLIAGGKPTIVKGSEVEQPYLKMKEILLRYIRDDMSDFEKVRIIYDWITNNVKIDHFVSQIVEAYNYLEEQDRAALTFYTCEMVLDTLVSAFPKDGVTENSELNAKIMAKITEWKRERNVTTFMTEFKTLVTSLRPYFIEGVVIDGYAVCDGICKTFTAMCLMENIECIRVFGQSMGQNHVWNKVRIDGYWYVVDCTWGNMATKIYGELSQHAYMLVPDLALGSTHEENNKEILAFRECNGIGDDSLDCLKYFVKDSSDLLRAFNEARAASGNTSLAFELRFEGSVNELQSLVSVIGSYSVAIFNVRDDWYVLVPSIVSIG